MSCVIFAKDVSRLVDFYRQVLNAEVVELARSHTVLVASQSEIVIHGVSVAVAKSIVIEDPPVLRSSLPIKPVFEVDSLQRVREVTKSVGGGLKRINSAWNIRGYSVLDGWDPEGNLVQFKQAN